MKRILLLGVLCVVVVTTAGPAAASPPKLAETPLQSESGAQQTPQQTNRDAKTPKQSSAAEADAAIRARYDKMVKARSGHSEYRLAHILVTTEAEAAAVLVELSKGKLFKDLARDRSTDGSAKNGGDLGWSVASVFPESFAQAVATMSKVGVYPKPVQTSFGWHVIQVNDIRPYEPPSYELFRLGLEALKAKEKIR